MGSMNSPYKNFRKNIEDSEKIAAYKTILRAKVKIESGYDPSLMSLLRDPWLQDDEFNKFEKLSKQEQLKIVKENETEEALLALQNKINNFEKNKNIPNESYFIVKDGEDYFYNNQSITTITKGTKYYIVFDNLYRMAPQGGTVKYDELGENVKKELNDKKINKLKSEKLVMFLQKNLTDNTNGFLKRAGIKNMGSKGKKLIGTQRGKAFEFNNEKR